MWRLECGGLSGPAPLYTSIHQLTRSPREIHTGFLLAAFWLDLGLPVLRSNKPLDHWPFWQQATKQPTISPEVTYGGIEK
jgi:hypothetical protein